MGQFRYLEQAQYIPQLGNVCTPRNETRNNLCKGALGSRLARVVVPFIALKTKIEAVCLPARLVMILLWICYAIATSPSFFMFSANVSVNHPGAKENKLP